MALRQTGCHRHAVSVSWYNIIANNTGENIGKKRFVMNRSVQDKINQSITINLSRGESVQLRHLQPEDADLLDAMFWKLSSRTRYQRFFLPLDDLPPDYVQQQARRLAQTDPEREAALIAIITGEYGPEAVAVGRYARLNTDYDAAEGALVVRDDYQGLGLGSRIFDLLVQMAMAQGIKELHAISHADNQGVLALIRQLGMPYENKISQGLQEFRLRLRDT